MALPSPMRAAHAHCAQTTDERTNLPSLPAPQEQHAYEFINETMVGLAAARKAKCEIDLVRGACRDTIGAAICKKSEALNAAVVVIAQQEKNFVEEIFSGGSVSKHVSQHCKQPTLIYQPRRDPVVQKQRQMQRDSSAQAV